MSSFTIHGPAPYPSSLLFDLGFEPAREYMTKYAYLFLLAAFRSKLSEYSCNLRLSHSLNHFR